MNMSLKVPIFSFLNLPSLGHVFSYSIVKVVEVSDRETNVKSD